ncbi:hypothetical protein GALL_482610 [mine drainage metagenome]|uniref:Uncharacterized protein n=1 Tax=mine drainage metagenome TaxID=410659 RepID=A0A1J5PXY7_9ZZZZ
MVLAWKVRLVSRFQIYKHASQAAYEGSNPFARSKPKFLIVAGLSGF